MKKYLIVMISVATFIFNSCGNVENQNTETGVEAQSETEKGEESKSNVEVVDYVTSISDLGDFSNYFFNSLLAEESLFSIKDLNGNVGFINSNGEIVIEPKYLGAMPFSEGLAFVVDQNNERYYIDVDENIVIDNVDGLKLGIGDKFENGNAIVALYDTEGESIQNNNYVIDKSGIAVLRPTGDGQYFWKVDNNAYATGAQYNTFVCDKLVDISGNEIDNSKYENFNQDKIFKLDNLDFYFIVDEATGLYAVYDKEKGKAVTDYIFTQFSDEYGIYPLGQTSDGKYIFVNLKGETILNVSDIYPTGVVADVINEDQVVINFNDGNTVKLIDFEGNLIKDTDFTHISYFIDGLAIIIKKDKYGYCNENLSEVLEAVYDSVTFAYDGSGLIVKDGILYKFQLEE